MRHAGIHFPENAGGERPNRETIARMPGMAGAALICSPSGRYHYDYLRRTNPAAVVVWRAIPRQGKLPAQLGWNPERVADECLNLWTGEPGAVHGGVEWFQPLNELQFDKEAGEPFRGYAYIAARLSALRVELQDRFHTLGQTVRLLFPPWVPQDDGDRLHEWQEEAVRWDGIALHCYGSAETMEHRYNAYRSAFPDHPIFVGEWNSNHEPHDEYASLAMWARIADEDPGFLGAAYYIWETNNAGEHDLSIWGNQDRLALFMNPPVANAPAPQEPIPMPEPKTREEVIAISNAAADEAGIPRLLLLACGIAESNLRWDARRPPDPAQDASYWADVSFGPWQQTARWSLEYKAWYTNDAPGHPPAQFPGSDVIEAVFDHYRDTHHAARVAARQLKAHYRPGESDAAWKALNRYNWPQGDGAPKSPGIGQNYRRGIDEATVILGEPAPDPAPQPGDLGPWPAITYEAHPIPAPGAFTGAPRGIVLHGSRSGAAGNSQDAEYRGTVNWAKINPAGLGWNVTIADHRVAEHLDVEHWGHHAKAASRHYLSIEFAQPTVAREITDAQADAAAHWIKTRVWPVWGELWHFPTHAEVQASGETGDQGNSDVYPLADPRLDVLRNRIYERLRQPLDAQPAPEPPPPAPSRAAVLVAEIEERLRELKALVA